MKHQVRCLALAGMVFAVACSADSVTDPSASQTADVFRAEGRPSITVMSRNLYIGTNVDAVIAALASPDPSDDFPALLNGISTLQETDFPTRAVALANEIELYRPHAIGLQEVTDLDLDLTPVGVPLVISLDFLPILQAELAGRGLNYIVAAQITNVQASPLPGISLVDHDALLVDASRVSLGSMKVEQNFSNNIGVVAPGVDIKRGFVAVDATIGGKTYVIANTHLESGSAPGLDQLRAAQAMELVATLGSSAPAIVLGDLNDIPGSLMHQVMNGGGFTDLWAALQPGERGFTCCHLANLANETQVFDQRLDYVFGRGMGRGQVIRTGEERTDRVKGPAHSLWPSDHAGLVANLIVPQP
jgi:hypothetical protein